MNIGYAPRKLLLDAFRQGWRLVPGHEYDIRDYAILVCRPEMETVAPEPLMKQWAKRFEQPVRQIRSNKSAANSGRRWGKGRLPA